jgi:hypothetical protein
MQATRLINSKNTSGYRGVSLSFGKWVSQIASNGILYRLGRFIDINMAAQAYNNFVIENKTHHPLNIIKSETV